MIHELKTTPEYFELSAANLKPFEIRVNDRPFTVGDFLALNEWDGGYTGRCMLVLVSNIMADPRYCKDGMITMSTVPCQIVDRDGKLRAERYITDSSTPIYGERRIPELRAKDVPDD